MSEPATTDNVEKVFPRPVDLTTAVEGDSLAAQVLNVMEQGIMVWGADDTCLLFNTRLFHVMELDPDAIWLGMPRRSFFEHGLARGEFTDAVLEESAAKMALNLAFQYDRHLPSGRIVETYARPTREGGYVVTFTDVTDTRRAAQDLTRARIKAEQAEMKARQILQEERARRAEARTLADLNEWLQSCKSLDELFGIVAKFMGTLKPKSFGEMYLYSNSRDVLDAACEWGRTGRMQDHVTPDACWSLRRGRMYTYQPDDLCFICDHVSHDTAVRGGQYLCIPVIAHGDTVGLLHINFTKKLSAKALTATAQFAAKCAEHISMAIANVQLRDELHDQSIRDPLTGLFNRRYFMETFRRMTQLVDRRGGSCGLITLDADKFKALNDQHGHDAGDEVLIGLAERMQCAMPDTAVCARLGGEEFAILLPDATQAQALSLAENLRKVVSHMDIRTGFGPLPRITISCGVVVYQGGGASTVHLLKRADEALYKAKDKGRNCVVSAEA